MRDHDDPSEPVSRPPTRRRLLVLGVAGAVLPVRPAIAKAVVGSVMNCQIPVPDPARAGSYIAADGSVVAPGTKGAFAPPTRAFTGEEVKRALAGWQLPGTNSDSHRAYLNYIRRLQRGTGGFTCFASLQMPRR